MGQQEQFPSGRGGHEAQPPMIAMVEEMTDWEHGRGRGSKDDVTESGQQKQLQYNELDLFDYGDAPPSLPLLAAHAKAPH